MSRADVPRRPSRRRSAAVRLLALVAAVLPLAALITPAAPAAAAGPAAPTVQERGGVAGRDYATDLFGDPWDYANADDLLLDNGGPAMSLANQRLSGGLAVMDVMSSGYVSPVWSGYEGSMLMGRDGSAPGLAIDADRYRTVSFSAYSSRDVAAGLMWFACPGGGVKDTCGGGQPVGLKAGWHTYVVRPGASAYAGGGAWTLPWAGQRTGLRFAVSPTTPTHVALDWMRLSTPGSGQQVGFVNPAPGQPAELLWDSDDDRTNNVPEKAGWGVVATTTAASASADLSVLPPADYALVVRSRGVSGPPLRSTLDAPLPVFTNPDEDGDKDFAATVLGDPWDMDQLSDVTSTHNTVGVGVAGGRLQGTNDVRSPYVNDPHLYLRTGPGIDSRTYRRLTLKSGYEGPFDLRDIAGGGTMGRVMWRRADTGSAIIQTTDVLTYSGQRSLTIDLGMPVDDLIETDQGNKLPFVSASPVTALRWDPNEDRGARRWSVDEVTLKSDFVAHKGFDVRWYDAAYRPGGTAELVADTDRTGCDGRTVSSGQPVVRGSNATAWDVAGTPAGRYWLCLRVTRGGAVAEQYAKSPVVVSGDAAPGSAPAAPAVPEVAAVAGGATVHWVAPTSPGSGLAGYEVKHVPSGEVRRTGAADPAGVAWAGLPPYADATFSVRALNDAGWGAWSATTPAVRPGAPSGSTFRPMSPRRVLATSVAVGRPVELQLRGRSGVPADATAVALNVTTTRASGGGALSVYPTGSASGTTTSNLNLRPGSDRPNAVTAKLSASGSVTISLNNSSADVLVDVFGAYVPDGGLGFHAVAPRRVLDTRTGAGALGPKGTRLLRLAGQGVPAGARAAVVNVTAAGVKGGGYVSTYPPGQADGPTTSVLNTASGIDVANLVSTAVDGETQVQLYNDNGGVDLIGDLQGWYDEAPDGLAFTPVSPWRVLDTRYGLGATPGKVGGHGTRVLDIAGSGAAGVPRGARAVVVNLTATEVEAPGTYVSAYPTGTAGGASTSNLNLPTGDTRPNLAVVQLAADGTVELYNDGGATHLLADVVGWFG